MGGDAVRPTRLCGASLERTNAVLPVRADHRARRVQLGTETSGDRRAGSLQTSLDRVLAVERNCVKPKTVIIAIHALITRTRKLGNILIFLFNNGSENPRLIRGNIFSVDDTYAARSSSRSVVIDKCEDRIDQRSQAYPRQLTGRLPDAFRSDSTTFPHNTAANIKKRGTSHRKDTII